MKGMSPKEINDNMKDTLVNDWPSYLAVKNRTADFKRGKVIIEDETRPR